jgi:hypothetical protein
MAVPVDQNGMLIDRVTTRAAKKNARIKNDEFYTELRRAEEKERKVEHWNRVRDAGKSQSLGSGFAPSSGVFGEELCVAPVAVTPRKPSSAPAATAATGKQI